jgi:hypothetical protein
MNPWRIAASILAGLASGLFGAVVGAVLVLRYQRRRDALLDARSRKATIVGALDGLRRATEKLSAAASIAAEKDQIEALASAWFDEFDLARSHMRAHFALECGGDQLAAIDRCMQEFISAQTHREKLQALEAMQTRIAFYDPADYDL